MIRTTCDPQADAMFIRCAADGVISACTEEVSPGVMLNFDRGGGLIGIGVLDVHERAAAQNAAA